MESRTYSEEAMFGVLAGSRVDPDLEHPHRPRPNVAGEIRIDPDIVLKAKAFDIQISFFYSTTAQVNRENGFRRSSSARAYIVNDPSSGVWAVRGDLTAYLLSEVSSAGSVTNYACGQLTQGNTTLSFDNATGLWREYFPDGFELQYQSQQVSSPQKYCLTAIVHPSGAQHTYSYGSGPLAGLLTTIEEPAGRVVSLNYEAGPVTSLLSSIEDWSGRRWSLSYDPNANLTAYTTPTGCQTQYTYSGSAGQQLLATIEDPRGFLTAYGYNSGGQVATMVQGAATWSYAYATGIQVETSPAGGVTTHILGSLNELARVHPEGYVSTYGYSPNRWKTSETVPYGLAYSLAFNASGQILVYQDALGNLITNLYDGIGNLTTVMDAMGNTWGRSYDVNRNLVNTIDPFGRRTTLTYGAYGNMLSFQDARGLATSWQYSALGYPTTQLNSDGGVVKRQFDGLGRVIAFTDATGRTTSLGYDPGDHVISMTDPAGDMTQYLYLSCLLQASIDPLSNRTSYSYGRFSNQLTMQNPLGYVWTNLWDNMGYPIGSIDPGGNQTTTVYNAAKQRIADFDALGFVTTQFYDPSGRRLATQNARGYITTNIWNARDIVSTQDALNHYWSSTYDALGRVVSQVSPLGFVNNSSYDAVGNRVGGRDAMGFRTTIAFDAVGNKTTALDANGLATTSVYSPTSNRLLSWEDPMGFITTPIWDLAGRSIGRINSLGYQMTIGYDSAGRQNVLQNELGYATTSAFDRAGRVSAVIDANGYVKSMTYDAAGNVLVKSYHDGTFVTNQYDPLNRLTTSVDWAGATSFAYSRRGELLGKTDPGGISLAFRYDTVSNRIGLIDPDGLLITVTFDALNRTSFVQKQSGHSFSPQYDADGRRTTLTLGSGVVRTYGLDPLNRVTTQIDYAGTSPISTMIDSYDPVGNRLTRLQDGVHFTWTHDVDYRLLGQQSAGATATFSYDALENTLVEWYQGSPPLTMTYQNGFWLHGSTLGSVVTAYGHDNVGNVISNFQIGGTANLFYDPENRLKRFQSASNQNSYYTYQGYDGLRRSALEPGLPLTTLVWDGSDYLQARD